MLMLTTQRRLVKALLAMALIFFGVCFLVLQVALAQFPNPNQVGCCECRPPLYISQGESRDCRKGNVTDKMSCMILCGYTAEQMETELNGPSIGYPKYSAGCDQNDCPIEGYTVPETCCVREKKIDNTIDQCVSGTDRSDCITTVEFSTTKGHFYERSCDEVNSCQAIGRVYDPDYDLTAAEKGERPDVVFKPQVSIPGSIKFGNQTFTVNQGQNIEVDGSLIAKYISLLFKWLIGAIGVVSVAVMAYGGMQWLAAMGSASQIDKAKTTIKDAVIGLLLGAASWSILFLINPRLISFEPLSIEEVKRCELEVADYGTPPANCQTLASDKGTCNVVDVSTADVTLAGPHIAPYLQAPVAVAFAHWMSDFHSQTGIAAQVNSMFRTPAYQACLYENLGASLANKPCTSTHEQGRAVDINTNTLTQEQYNLLKTYGNIYGFRPQNPNKGEPESWHFTYYEDDAIRSVTEVCPNTVCTGNITPPKGCFVDDE